MGGLYLEKNKESDVLAIYLGRQALFLLIFVLFTTCGLTSVAMAKPGYWTESIQCAEGDPHGAWQNGINLGCGDYYVFTDDLRIRRCYQGSHLLPFIGYCSPDGLFDEINWVLGDGECNINISAFNSTSQTIQPLEKVGFNGTISDSSGKMIYWTIALPNNEIVTGTGASPSASWYPSSEGTYTVTLTAAIDLGTICSDKKSIQVTVSSCNLQINVQKQTIERFIGGDINISGNITDSSGKPITWEIVLPNGIKKEGTGNTGSALWDGKIDGKIQPGTYTATITARSGDTCSKTESVPITICSVSDDNGCSFQVQVGSSAHVANGNLSHSQELFSSKGSALSVAMDLYYNSIDPNNGPLGLSWSHSYDISLKENSDGSVLLKETSWGRKLYTLSNGSYISQPGDYSILVKNADNTFTLTRTEGTRYNFNSDGKITAIVDRNGNTDTFVHTGGNLTAITDPGGRTAAFSYDSDNHLTSITDPSGNSYTFTYTAGTLSSVTYPDGGVWHYTYDDKAFMLTKTDPMGNTTSYTYDDSHRIASSTDPEGKTRSVSYPTGTDTVKTTTFTEKDGGVWLYTYDTTKGTLNQKIDPQGGVTSYTYDASANPLTITKPDGSTTSYTYDSQGNMTSLTDALGNSTVYTYNSLGEVLSVKDPQGNTITYTYDDHGNMASMTDATGATTKYDYDAKGNGTKVTDPAGLSSTLTYDATGNLSSITDPAGAKTSFTYDAAGNMTSRTDATGQTTTFDYNAKNQPVKITDALGNATTYTYDLAGNRISETDANGNSTSYEYNASGQVVKTKDALGNVTVFTYGGTGCASCGGGTDKLTSLTDANGNATTYNYDNLGRLLNETDPLGNITSYDYDTNGNLTAKTDANGNTIKYGYDSLGRLTKKSYPDGTEAIFTYDAKGNILTTTNKNISYTFTYDPSGRVLSVTDANGRLVKYDYDLAGRRTRLTYPDNSVVGYSYDQAGRLAAITSGDKTFSLSYDSLGRRTGLDYPDGTKAKYTYDDAGRLTGLVHKKHFGPALASFTYAYDKVGNRLSKEEPQGKINYGYDKVYRLLQALPDRGLHRQPGPWGEDYTYDPVGNRLTGHLDRLSYDYNQANQLTAMTRETKGSFAGKEHQGPCAANQDQAQYGYDKNGNLVRKVEPAGSSKYRTITLYTYDYENRLTKVEIQRGHWENVVTFTYDPFGRRLTKAVQREEIEDNDRHEGCEHGREIPRTTSYVYDSQDIILEYNARGDITSKYIHGPGTDEPLALYRGRESYYYHADGLGSIVALTDRHGNAVQKYDYDSFRNLKQGLGPIDQPYTYTGKEWDSETGLYYYRARYYDPSSGRFISRDPIGFNGGINQYAYVRNNPLKYIDPRGLLGEQFEPVVEEEVNALIDRYGPEFVEWLQKLFARNPSTSKNCVNVANKVYDAFQKVGTNPEIIQITDSEGADYFFNGKGLTFAESGFHQAVRVGDMVYDSITGISGMQYNTYINTLISFGIYPSVEVIK
jgi:RHS repeat-associated protein